MLSTSTWNETTSSLNICAVPIYVEVSTRGHKLILWCESSLVETITSGVSAVGWPNRWYKKKTIPALRGLQSKKRPKESTCLLQSDLFSWFSQFTVYFGGGHICHANFSFLWEVRNRPYWKCIVLFQFSQRFWINPKYSFWSVSDILKNKLFNLLVGNYFYF